MSKRGNSPYFEDDDGNDHLFISLDENPPKRCNWGPAMMYMPEGHSGQPSAATALEVPSTASKMRFAQPPAATPEVPSTKSKMRFAQTPVATPKVPSTASKMRFPQPSTAAPQSSTTAGSPLGK
ncbi:hypothetical protein AVEN_178045-1 [Araneus ventricosus]|uniref:Uncharacterized protein n=1 Tax=Araneus ventricosus TaxID=182803 RepID=A0A4Y2I407_ARAVE|nr:hypothetical protein AVEN_178045-1 [Araneus ventricosus]